MTTALYYDAACLEHDTLDHPENAERLVVAMALLEESGLLERLARPECRDATEEELTRIHRREHIEQIRHISSRGPVMLPPDTIANKGTYTAALRAAGAVVAAVESVCRGEYDNAFCLVRPPGHHAIAGRAMGFCFFNSVAVAAAHARAALDLGRVAIVDIDIHHGNGTQDAFYADPDVLYVSTHQYPFYPGTGHWRETGEGRGVGATVNVPLPFGCGVPEFALVFDEVVMPALYRFRPDLVLVSAGFDAHWADPIDGAGLRLTCEGYAGLVRRLMLAAVEMCHGRIVVALEGGYNLTALSWCVRNSIETLMGIETTPDPVGAPPPAPAPDITPLVAAVRDLHGLRR